MRPSHLPFACASGLEARESGQTSQAALAVPDSIVIGAALAHRPGYGGHAWALLQYALGFRRLGFDVTIVDRLEPGMVAEGHEQDALRSLRGVLRDFDLDRSYSVLGPGGSTVDGLSRDDLLQRMRDARFLLNIMGFVNDPEVLAAVRRRVFLDIDPGFGQTWRELELADIFDGHDDFVTVGRNVGTATCDVPTCGLRWLTTPHPVVLDLCPVVDGGADFTSVGTWRGPYDRVDYGGTMLGLRVHEFRTFMGLPRRVDARFRLALEIDPTEVDDVESLRAGGWDLHDPHAVAGDPSAYLRFVQGSLAEFTVAKGIYRALRTGWLGDRTACYLASGKPALVQDTGLTSHYPLGEGLLAFSTLEDAADGVREILRDYPRHARAARHLAEAHLDARLVLGRLLEELG